ncbi:alpha/beta hydrolase [Candidatus Sumerlaeota bacterium]|nr:alpha/beta hydrolase [Candidatus Sumerlaeota bacterium]
MISRQSFTPKFPRQFRKISVLLFLGLLLAAPLLPAESEIPSPPEIKEKSYNQQKDVIYDNDVDGVALVMDIFTPKGKPNGAAIVDVASGSWYSDRGKIKDHEQAQFFQNFCERGYIVFAVRPGSQTKFTGEEMLANVKRGVRWARNHAADYKIDPARIGIAGASAGGHLASLAAVTADDGDPKAKDPVARESCRVKAAGVFFPPADFVAWGAGKVIAKTAMKGLFFAGGDINGKTEEDFTAVFDRLSPARHVTAEAPPFLIFHGTKDPLVPLAQSELLLKALHDKGVKADLIIKEGGGHPWPTIYEEVKVLADWFDKNL